LQCFRTSEYESHLTRNPKREPGTLAWFLRHEQYQHWRQGQESRLLWVSADPGCGKSVLSRFLVEEELCSVKSQESLHTTVCFFFFKDDNDEQKNASAALCALLHQVLSQRKSLVRHAMPAFEANGKKLREMFHILWNILIAAAADPDCGNVVCIIDALDECEELSRGPFLESLVRFFSKPTGPKE
jgi:hypothetical protein